MQNQLLNTFPKSDEEFIKLCKNATILLFRLNKLDPYKYAIIIKTFENMPYMAFINYSNGEDDSDEVKNCWINFFTLIGDITDKEIENLEFLNEEEKEFYTILPDDLDAVETALLFFLLPPDVQTKRLYDVIGRFNLYGDPEAKREEEKSLLKDFRVLSRKDKKQVRQFIDFLHFSFIHQPR